MRLHPTILLIDDSPSVREVFRVAQESEGYHVIEAADGREGVLLYREHRPALVIADIVMPEKDGCPKQDRQTSIGPVGATRRLPRKISGVASLQHVV